MSSRASAPASERMPATSLKSSKDAPKKLATTGIPSPLSSLMASTKYSAPGFGSPIALSAPPSTEIRVGFWCPILGTGPRLFVTTAPAPPSYTRFRRGADMPRTPAAFMTGFLSRRPATSTAKLNWDIPSSTTRAYL